MSDVARQMARIGFRSARLPLSLVEHVAGRSGMKVAAWPPVAVYDALEAEAKKLVGQLVGDEELVEEGARQESAVRHRTGARWLADEAEEIRRSADGRLHEEVEQVEQARDEVRQSAADREKEIERRESEGRRQAEERAERRDHEAARLSKARQRSVRAKERQAERARVEAEAAALEKEAEAVEAEKVLTAIDERLTTRKAAR